MISPEESVRKKGITIFVIGRIYEVHFGGKIAAPFDRVLQAFLLGEDESRLDPEFEGTIHICSVLGSFAPPFP